LSESIFRKKSLDNISLPEKKDEYIRVTRPGFWLVAGAILMLISAILAWCIVNEIESEIENESKSEISGEMNNMDNIDSIDNINCIKETPISLVTESESEEESKLVLK